MFTDRVTQKQKKWVDGTATFKLINKDTWRYSVIVKDSEDVKCHSCTYTASEGLPDPGDTVKISGSCLLEIDTDQDMTAIEPVKIQDLRSTIVENVPKSPALPNRMVGPVRRTGLMRSGVRPPTIQPINQPKKTEYKPPTQITQPKKYDPPPKQYIPPPPPELPLEKPRTYSEILSFFDSTGVPSKPVIIPQPLHKTTKEVDQQDIKDGTNKLPDNKKEETQVKQTRSIDEILQDPTIYSTSSTDDELESSDSGVGTNSIEIMSQNPDKILTPPTPPKPIYDILASKMLKLQWADKKLGPPPRIPITFESIEQYQSMFIDGLTYELNVRIQDIYKKYAAALFSAANKPPKCPQHGNMMFCLKGNGEYFYKCRQCKNTKSVPADVIIPEVKQVKSMAAVSNFMHSKCIGYHESTFSRKGGNCTLRLGTDKVDKVEYSRDDIWVIFGERTPPVFAISTSFGVFGGNRVDIEPFFSNLNNLPMNLRCTAIRLFNAQSEAAALAKLFELNNDLPILPTLLTGSPSSFEINEEQHIVEEVLEEFYSNHVMNDDQKKALSQVAAFFHDNTAPVVLVHGIFGAGKSKLLSIIAMFLDEVLTKLGRDDKVLIAASTNVAVDNVLANLLDSDFTQFTRVGSVKKIKKCILPYVTGHGTDEAISELSSLISEADKNEIGIVKEALQNARSELDTKTSKIDVSRIVGVTCAATAFAVMQGRKFTFVLLDECSQQTEPISLLPVVFGCARLVCCGDPLQLPPTISKPAPQGYGRPLFSRLAKFFPPTMLSVQYRCHPMIAEICNKIFYKSKIVHGVSAEDRSPLFDFPTMCCFDVKCGKEEMKGGSYVNYAEAHTVTKLVQYLLDVGVSPNEIGVIAFYKAQVSLIAEPLMEGHKRPIVDVSTVDAFQGDEREIIIITTTRHANSSFIDSRERLNVAISRARRHLFFITCIRPLINSEIWGQVFSMSANKPNRKILVEEMPTDDWKPFS